MEKNLTHLIGLSGMIRWGIDHTIQHQTVGTCDVEEKKCLDYERPVHGRMPCPTPRMGYSPFLTSTVMVTLAATVITNLLRLECHQNEKSRYEVAKYLLQSDAMNGTSRRTILHTGIHCFWSPSWVNTKICSDRPPAEKSSKRVWEIAYVRSGLRRYQQRTIPISSIVSTG